MPSNLSDEPDDRTADRGVSDPQAPAVPVSLNFPDDFLARPVFEGRLHPFTLLFGLIKGLRRAAPAIPFILFGNRAFAGFLVMIFITTIVSALTHYFSFSYRIDDNELITEQGLLARKHRSIPLERVQEIRIEQGVLHRIFGVVDAKIETGGGEGAEASLSVLSRDEAERLRRTVFERAAAIKRERFTIEAAEGAESGPMAPERVTIRRLGLQDLVLAGVTSNHLISALFLVGALWKYADDLLPDRIYDWLAQAVYHQVETLRAYGAAKAAVITVLAAVLVFIIGLCSSIIASILLFYRFTFSRLGEDLHRSYGLITRRTSSLPRRRIQVLKIEERLLRRLFGLATLRVDTSGRNREGEDKKDGRDVLIPILRRREVDELLPGIFENIATDRAEWQSVSRLAIRRGTIKGGVICLLLAAASFLYQGELVALWPLAGLPLVYWLNLVRYRNLSYAMGERYFRTRRGWLGRSTHIVPVNKIQAVLITQTPLDRRLGLATLSIDTAGQAYTGGGPQIGNLPLARAREIAATLAHRASTTTYKW